MAETIASKAGYTHRHVEYWAPHYDDPGIPDGTSWSLRVRYSGHPTVCYYGIYAWPDNWPEVLEFFGMSETADPGDDDADIDP